MRGASASSPATSSSRTSRSCPEAIARARIAEVEAGGPDVTQAIRALEGLEGCAS